MAVKCWGYVVLVCLFGSGCRVIHDVDRTVLVEPSQFNFFGEENSTKRRYRKMARYTLTRTREGGGACLSQDYAGGFEDGYVDYLFAGGNGQPPPLPPRRYWGRRYQSEWGRRAALDWFAGFRDGAAEAKSSGYRELVTVPSSRQSAMNAGPPIDARMEPMPAPADDLYDIPPAPAAAGTPEWQESR
jgi:hypothetical protein